MSHSRLYRLGERGWVKVKNPNYWRRDAELEAMARKHERRAKTRALRTQDRRAGAVATVAPVAPLVSDGGEVVDGAAAPLASDQVSRD